MQTNQIIAEIDSEIQRLERAKALLTGNSFHGAGGRPAASSAAPKKRHLSTEARARIAAAQKARWARVKKAVK